MTNGVTMDWIGAIAKESLTGAILCLVLFAFFRYLRRADEDFRVEMRRKLSRDLATYTNHQNNFGAARHDCDRR
ncbi:MAG: hypothetical protein KatS3mg038_2604 [Candidatus Kapaibacterium sp.]|nr:MAG: hypothetical protein KatS3mg038_2604 [Candidatus Kapabacteria bacterium]